MESDDQTDDPEALIPWAIGAGAALAAFFTARWFANPGNTAQPMPAPPGGYRRILEIGEELEQLGAPAGMRYMMAWRAHSESKGNALACNGDRCPSFTPKGKSSKAPSSGNIAERKATQIAVQRSESWLRKSPYPLELWAPGSGGWFGMFPPYAVGFVRSRASLQTPEQMERWSPWDIFDPWRSSVAFADMVRRTMMLGNWASLPPSERTWEAIQRSGASLATMGDWQLKGSRAQAVRRNAELRIKESGGPAGFSRLKVPPFSEGWSAAAIWDKHPREVPTP